jgi:predicted HTH transcriptional regulator
MEEIDQIVNARSLNDLVGRAEDVQFEAKGQHYDLLTEHGRFELAKDVTAFANTTGGHLLIGLVTERPENTQLDVVSRIDLIAPEIFNEQTILGCVRTYVFPRVVGITAEFIAAVPDTAGIIVIRVPPQPEDAKPFLVLRVVEGGGLLSQALFGLYERVADANQPMEGRRFQEALRKGLDSAAQRMTRIEDKLDMLLENAREPAPRPVAADHDLMDRRIRSAIEEAE